MDPERMNMVSEAVVRAREAFGEEWNSLTPRMKLFFIKKALEFMEEDSGWELDAFKLIEATHKELRQVMELERRAKMMLEARATA
jgi:hypothetical protein